MAGLNKNKPVVLRKLVEGETSLYVYEKNEEEKKFVAEKEGKFNYLVPVEEARNVNRNYMRWLSDNLNPNGYEYSYYAGVDYNKSDLIRYFLSHTVGAEVLFQEPKVDTFKLYALGGFTYHFLGFNEPYGSGSSSASNFNIGLRLMINLDRLENNHSLFVSLNYHTPLSYEEPFRIRSQSDAITEEYPQVKWNYYSGELGYSYSFHNQKYVLAPYISYQPLIVYNTERTSGISVPTRDYLIDYSILSSINVGCMVFGFESFVASLNAGYLINGYDEKLPGYGLDAINISLQLGYRIF